MVCASPYAKDIQDPSVVVVLLSDDVIAIDLTSHNFTQYPAPYGNFRHDYEIIIIIQMCVF